jgi:hypothetical protein
VLGEDVLGDAHLTTLHLLAHLILRECRIESRHEGAGKRSRRGKTDKRGKGGKGG